MEAGEDAETCARRELLEETGIVHDGPLSQVDDHAGFITFLGETPEEIEPTLNREHEDAHWTEPNNTGLIDQIGAGGLHPGVAHTLSKFVRGAPYAADCVAQDRLAFDRASVRTKDTDGRLHVSMTNISKANVCPYLGKEIPNAEALGLDPDKIYRLLRDPAELEKAARTFNNLPLLIVHKPVNADEPARELTIGTTGTDAVWEAPYLRNSLAVWDAEGIAGIESEEQRELSSAYHYTPDMTPGEYEGDPYDGVMRDIIGNHVALVEEGRAGADVVVQDGALVIPTTETTAEDNNHEDLKMIKTKALLSRKALLVQGALIPYLAPRLAADAALDLGPILDGLTRKNFAGRRAGIASAITKATTGKLAQDADLGDLVELLDTMKGIESGDPEDDDLTLDAEVINNGAEDPERTNGTAEDDDTELMAKLKAAGLDDETIAKVCAAMKPAADAEVVDPANAAEQPDFVSKGAMDAAIAKAVKTTERTTVTRMNAIREAEATCKPFIGELAVAMDSAESIYQLALEAADVNLEGISPSAYRAMVGMLPQPGARTAGRPTMAEDAAAATSFAERHPDASRIKTA